MMRHKKINRGVRKRANLTAALSDEVSPQTSFVDFLTVVQSTGTLSIHVTPEEGRDILGSGASGIVQQTPLNAGIDLAFKHGIRSGHVRDHGKHEEWSSLVREIRVLQHKIIRENPNIVNLLGVCFRIRPHDGGTWRAWPTLISRKFGDGHLGSLLASPRVLTMEERLRLFGHVTNAVRTLHQCGIAHGDLKPANFLVDDPQGCELACVLNDFGSSVIDGELRWPTRNERWSAGDSISNPPRRVGFAEIQQLDYFALGLLALHILVSPKALKAAGIWRLQNRATETQMEEAVASVERLELIEQDTFVSLLRQASNAIEASHLPTQVESSLRIIVEQTLRSEERSCAWVEIQTLIASSVSVLDNPSRMTTTADHEANGTNDFRLTPEADAKNHERHHILGLNEGLVELDDTDYVVRQTVFRDIEYKYQHTSCESCRTEYTKLHHLCNAIRLGGLGNDSEEASDPTIVSILQAMQDKYSLVSRSESTDLRHHGIDVVTKHNQVAVYELDKRLHEARDSLKIELEARRRLLKDPVCIAVILTDLAAVSGELGMLTEAYNHHQELVNILQNHTLLDKRRLVEARVALADTLHKQHSIQTALDILRDVFHNRNDNGDTEYMPALNAGLHLSQVLSRVNQFQEAEAVLDAVRKGFSRRLGSCHDWTFHADTYYIRNLRAQAKFDDARVALKELEEKLGDIVAGNSLQAARLNVEWAQYYNDVDDLTAAETSARKAINMASRLALPETSDLNIWTLRCLGTISGRQGNRIEEERVIRKILAIQTTIYDNDPPVWDTKHQLAACLKWQNKPAEALRVTREVMESSKLSLEREPHSIIGCAIIESSIVQSMGMHDQACEMLQALWKSCQDQLGPDHPLTLQVAYYTATATYNGQDFTKTLSILEGTLPRILERPHPNPQLQPLIIELLEYACQHLGALERWHTIRTQIATHSGEEEALADEVQDDMVSDESVNT